MASSRTDRVTGLGAAVAVKAPVLVASTGNITSLSSAQTIDGVVTSSGDRVLVWQQTDASENGIYEVATTWGRTKDFDGANEVVRGTVAHVNAGTNYAGNWYKVTSTGDNVPGTDNITFAQASAPTSLTTLTGDLNTSGYVINHSEGASVASNTTANIWNSSGNTVFITGTAAIVSLGEAPVEGAWRRTIFGASNTIAHSTTSIFLDSTGTLLTQAGDVADWYADSTSLIRLVQYLPQDRTIKTAPIETDATATTVSNNGMAVFTGDTSNSLITVDPPITGCEKEVFLKSSATALIVDFTSSTVFTGVNTSGTTSLTFTSSGLFGGYVVLRCTEPLTWNITSKSTHVSS